MYETIYLAGGCFWGLQKYMDSEVDGVIQTETGYANGILETVTYSQLCGGGTGFCETVKVVYDTDKISLSDILKEYYYTIDPTSVNRQGNDIGSQYRTGIYYTNDNQREIIENSLKELQNSYKAKIAVECLPLTKFITAENYHQKYLDKNRGGYCHINFDKIKRLKSAVVNPKLYSRKSTDELKKLLTERQYNVTQNNEDEPPYSGLWDNFDMGIYTDVTTGEPLFSSKDKVDNGSGYPCFKKPIDPNTLIEIPEANDTDIKILSRVGRAYLGRINSKSLYILNSSSLNFIPYENMEKDGYGYLKSLFC